MKSVYVLLVTPEEITGGNVSTNELNQHGLLANGILILSDIPTKFMKNVKI